jgi:hypothetical protein
MNGMQCNWLSAVIERYLYVAMKKCRNYMYKTKKKALVVEERSVITFS